MDNGNGPLISTDVSLVNSKLDQEKPPGQKGKTPPFPSHSINPVHNRRSPSCNSKFKSSYAHRSGSQRSSNTAPSTLYRRPHPASVSAGAVCSIGVSSVTPRRRRRKGFGDPSHSNSMSTRPSASASASASSSTAKDLSKGKAVQKSSDATGNALISVAVMFWYAVGVVSITSSKILLTTHNVPPLVLTLQQCFIGMTLLRTFLEIQTSGPKDDTRQFGKGLQPLPVQSDGDTGTTSVELCEAGMIADDPHQQARKECRGATHGTISAIFALIRPSNHAVRIHNQLFLAAIYFAMGFLLTNYGFQSGSAAFVETVKAAEPFTSATVAVLWGIEKLGKEEIISLIGIVMGVLLSTLGHGTAAVPHKESMNLTAKCLLVMLSNLCFSFRGLHQKLFRATPQGNASILDDLNLQYRMQQIGVLALIFPTMSQFALMKMCHFPSSGSALKYTLRYTLLSLTNGFAFTSYNLASTFVLSRISVVHHSALNCIRRVFAIIATSLIFGNTITLLQGVGVTLTMGAFFTYIHFKMKKEAKVKRKIEQKDHLVCL